jgi:hypothetical protein
LLFQIVCNVLIICGLSNIVRVKGRSLSKVNDRPLYAFGVQLRPPRRESLIGTEFEGFVGVAGGGVAGGGVAGGGVAGGGIAGKGITNGGA